MTNGSLSFVPRDRLEEALALLQGTRLGRIFASGLVAVEALLHVTPIAKTPALARAKGHSHSRVDNTLATPLLQRPIALGADIKACARLQLILGLHLVVDCSIDTADQKDTL